jgi:hypothetical protein
MYSNFYKCQEIYYNYMKFITCSMNCILSDINYRNVGARSRRGDRTGEKPTDMVWEREKTGLGTRGHDEAGSAAPPAGDWDPRLNIRPS